MYQNNQCINHPCENDALPHERYCEPCEIKIMQAQEASRLEQASEGFGYHERKGLIYLAYGNEEE
jgi:hypothetical protein